MAFQSFRSKLITINFFVFLDQLQYFLRKMYRSYLFTNRILITVETFHTKKIGKSQIIFMHYKDDYIIKKWTKKTYNKQT